MTRPKVLFPISVDNPQFTTAFLLHASEKVVREHPEGVFLVADELQLYNKAAGIENAKDLNELFRRFTLSSRYHEERHAWLSNIKQRLGRTVDTSNWKVCSVSDYVDPAFYSIYRNLVIAYNTVTRFTDAVNNDVKTWMERRRRPLPIRCAHLSALYLLEETALNIRLHALEGITIEFYAFQYPSFFRTLYSGELGVDIYAIAGVNPLQHIHEFWSFDTSTNEWKLAFSTTSAALHVTN